MRLKGKRSKKKNEERLKLDVVGSANQKGFSVVIAALQGFSLTLTD